MPEELIYLPASGAIPGIPGEHSPGTYWLDALNRTIRRADTGIEKAADPVPEVTEKKATSKKKEGE